MGDSKTDLRSGTQAATGDVGCKGVRTGLEDVSVECQALSCIAVMCPSKSVDLVLSANLLSLHRFFKETLFSKTRILRSHTISLEKIVIATRIASPFPGGWPRTSHLRGFQKCRTSRCPTAKH